MTDRVRKPARRDVSHRAAAGDGELLRRQLLDAAEERLQEHGTMQAVSLRQVARDVGVSPTAVYLHFSDKDDLFLAVCTRRFQAFGELLRAAREGLDSAADRVLASGRAYVRFGIEHPEQYAVLFGGAVPMDVVRERLAQDERVGLQVIAELAAEVQRGVERGEFRRVDVEAATYSLWAMVHGLVGVIAHGKADDEPLDVDALVAAGLSIVMDGLRAG